VGGFPLKRAALSSPRDWRQCSKSQWHPSIGAKRLPAADATSSRPASIDPVSESIVPMTEPIARRRFLSHIGSLPLLGTSLMSADWACGAAPRSTAEMADAQRRVTDGALYWAWWGWEPWEHHRRAGGTTGAVDGSSHWLHQWYARLHSEELVEQMAKAGVNMAVNHFFKGFGLEHERTEQERTAQLVQLAHKHGIRVIGYCQLRSLYYETFMLEEPSAENWIQRDPFGRPIVWNKQYFRWTPCINCREFRDYQKRVVRVGLEETGLDGFNFDNCMSLPCYCPRCEKAFRRWMVERYPEPRDLFGLGTLEGVRQPPAPASDARVEDPLTRAWLRWRCENLEDFAGEIARYARSLRPETILMANPGYPTRAGMAVKGLWPVNIGQHLNLMIAENSASPEVLDDKVISQIRAYRHGIAIGYRPASTTWAGGVGREASSEASSALPQSPYTVKLQVAEAVDRVAEGRLTARLYGSTYVAMSAFQTKENQLAVHLLNYAAPKAAGPLRLELGRTWSTRTSARLMTPEGANPQLTLARQGDRTTVEIPSLDVYGILVIG